MSSDSIPKCKLIRNTYNLGRESDERLAHPLKVRDF